MQYKSVPQDWTANTTVVEVRLPNGRMVKGTVKRAWDTEEGRKLRIQAEAENITVEAKRVVRIMNA